MKDHLKKRANSIDGALKFLEILSPNSLILDVGSGGHEAHSNMFREHGHIVETCDFHKNATYRGIFNDIEIPQTFDGIWSAHCLEHQPNPHIFLKKIFNLLKEAGIVCVTVPPLKEQIVSGHINLYYPGLLLYQMVLAGFNCDEAKIKSYGYNISIITEKKSFVMPKLNYDKPDLKTLREYFPLGLEWDSSGRGFYGLIDEINWKS
jgi:SAM-dependent methyltransferase